MEALILTLLGLGFCFLLSFFFSGSETAVISAARYKLQNRADQGERAAELTLRMLDNPHRIITAVLIGTQGANVLLALLFKMAVDLSWPESGKISIGVVRLSELLGIFLLTPVVVLFAEILPKAIFRAKADNWIVGLRPVLAFFLKLFLPVIWALDGLVTMTLALIGATRGERPRLTRADVILMLNPPAGRELRESAESAESAEANHNVEPAAQPPSPATAAEPAWMRRDPDERELIRNIIELDHTYVGEIMRPLIELTAIHVSQSVDKTLDIARSSGYSRFPVYRGRIINLIGFIDVYEIIRHPNPRRLEDFVKPAHYVPETKRVDDLLQEFLDKRLKNAVVVNEYGGCVGWVTLEDILEEIVGELEDELDLPETLVRDQGDGSYLIEGRIHIEDFNDALGLEIDDPDCDTLGGVIMKETGRIPSPGDEVALQGWRMTIHEMDGLRVKLVHVRPDSEPEAAEEE